MFDSDKNRYIRAARLQSREGELSFQESSFDIVHINRVLDKDYPLSCRPYEIVPQDLVEFSRRIGNDMVLIANLWELGRHNEIDANGRKHYVDGTMKTPDCLRKIKAPDIGDYERKIDAILDSVEGTGLGVIASVELTPKLVTVAMGYQDYMIAILENPGFVRDFQKRVAEYSRRQLDMILSKPVDVVQTGIDICANTGPMYSPGILEEFEFPWLREVVQRVRDDGKLMCLHIDGYVESLIPSFIDMGVNVLNPIEPSEKQSMVELNRRFGTDIAFHGNLDVTSVLSVMSSAQVREKTRELIQAMSPGNGFILASSHDISEDIPWENFLAMRETASEFNVDLSMIFHPSKPITGR